MKTYRVAIIGCRHRGAQQAQALRLHPRTELVALCDLVPERRNALGDDAGVTARYADFTQMIREQEPDLVSIPTASRFHGALAEAVLKLGCHVDVEKPFTLTLEEADRVLAAQRASGKRVGVHHQRGLYPPTRKLRDLVRQGYIGEPQAFRLRDKGYYGGFGIFNMGCHALAWVITMAGPARSVMAQMVTAGHLTTVDEVYQGPLGYGLVAGEKLTCLFDLPDGAYLVCEEHQRPNVSTPTMGFEVVGTEGALAHDRSNGERVLHCANPFLNPGNADWHPIELTHDERTLYGYDYADPVVGQTADLWMVDEWVHALDEERDPLFSGAVGAATTEMMIGALASHVEGRRIVLPRENRGHPLEQWLRREGRPTPPPRPADETYDEWLRWAMAQARDKATTQVAIPARV